MALNYVPPSEIDGGPAEVEREAINQLVSVFDETVAQVRNAHMSRVLDAEPSATPEDLRKEWIESDRCAAVTRIRILMREL